MNLTELNERLIKLDNSKLTDVVKNYKQYGYDESIRRTALDILKSRGIEEDDLKLTGNFNNYSYERAIEIAGSYTKNSRTTFLLYLTTIITRFFLTSITSNSESLGWTFLIITILSFTLYFVFLILSALNHVKFYKTIGKELGTGDIIMYVIVGMPFYIFLYFYYKKQMKEEMKLIK